MKKNLVLGVAKSYSWDILEPFVNSCKKNCQSADIVFFVDDISDFTRDKLIQEMVIIKDFPDEMKAGIPNNTRWKIFADFLNEHGNDYEQIFISDTRDAIFQGDVFEQFNTRQNYLCCATEADDIRGSRMGDKTNYNWLVDCFGKDEADKLLDKKIICSGTVLGTSHEMKIFCGELWKTLAQKTWNIFDQAAANYLIHNDLLPIENLIESDVESGAIFTKGLLQDNKIRNEKILRGDGGVPAVVHQYDRHSELVRLVDEIYREGIFQFDERFNDTRSIIEQVTSLLRANKIGEATRIFLRKYLTNPDFSKSDILLINLFKAAINIPVTQSSELLLLAIQEVMYKNVRVLSEIDFAAIVNFLIRAKNLKIPVDPEFKNYITNFIFQAARQELTANNFENCLRLINKLKTIGMPPDKDFYLLVAKANRLTGRKNEALAAYKKVLELS